MLPAWQLFHACTLTVTLRLVHTFLEPSLCHIPPLKGCLAVTACVTPATWWHMILGCFCWLPCIRLSVLSISYLSILFIMLSNGLMRVSSFWLLGSQGAMCCPCGGCREGLLAPVSVKGAPAATSDCGVFAPATALVVQRGAAVPLEDLHQLLGALIMSPASWMSPRQRRWVPQLLS